MDLTTLNVAHLIAESVASNDDRLDPAWNRFRNSFQDDRFAEDSSAKNIAYL
jgi:hypothetical protein